MAGSRSVYRIARSLLIALAAVLALGVVGSFLMGVRATSQAKAAATEQARAIVDNSLPLALSPSDVATPASDTRAEQITEKITPVVLDPTPYDIITIWSTAGTIVYATDRSLIGQRPEESRTIVRDATTRGTVTTEQHEGYFSVLAPLRLRDGQISAAVELSRPDDPIATASRPWRYDALFLAIVLVIVCVVLYRVMRLSSSMIANTSFLTSNRVAPSPVQAPLSRPFEVPAPGLREEAEARRKAEERAQSAEERLTIIQDQYKKTLEELHVTQRLLQERPQPGGPDPVAEERLLRAEGQVRLLEGQLKAMSTERDKLARHIAEQAKAKPQPDPELERRTRQVEQEAIGLRAELEGAQTELSLTRRELESLRSEAGKATEAQGDLDAAHVEVLRNREALESSQQELARAKAELDDTRTEMRALRTEEQKAAVLSEEVRAAKAEIESLKASHRAELVEREAELETGVRRTREEFQAQLEELQTQAKRQLAEREATLTSEASEREATLMREAAARESQLSQQLAEREAALQSQLAEREATLQAQLEAVEAQLAKKLSDREQELLRRVAEAEETAEATGAELAVTRSSMDTLRGELQVARDEIDAAVHDGSSQHAQLAKANEELLRSQTEIETLQRELAEAERKREEAHGERDAAIREREAVRTELASTSAEVQAELARGVELAQRAERAERELRETKEGAARSEEKLAGLRASHDELTRSLADAEARHAAELAAATAAGQPDAEMEQTLRSAQERLARQTEKLLEVEERAHSAERQFADAVVRLEEVEAELRHLQMEKALHDLQGERAPADESLPARTEPLEDRRASTPFVKELSLDAKKTLTHILGLTQIMKYKKDSKDQAQLIKQLTVAARRLDHTVSDIADADALAFGEIELTIKRIDLEALVKRVVEESAVSADHDVRIDSEPLVVAIDALRTEQVLAGMLRTSGDRTATGKAITVRAKHVDGGALLSVEDPEPSSDISLSPVVTRFVEVQGGWVKVESRDGGGSAFQVFLPDGGPNAQAAGSARSEGTSSEDGQPSAPGTLQIMVAEPGSEPSPDWGGSEEQLLVQELHRLHAED